MRLILMFSYDGGYECGSCNQIWPIEYADKDSALFDLLELIVACKKANEEFQAANAAWYASIPRLIQRPYGGQNTAVLEKRALRIERHEVELREWMQCNPRPIFPGNSIQFCGRKIEVDSDLYIDEIRILTLDEWYSNADSL